MRKIFLALSLSLPLFAQANCLTNPDNTGGNDAHIGISFMLGAASAGIWREKAWYTQAGIALLPGIAKELADCRSSKLFSRQDLKNDLLGALLGVAFVNTGIALSHSSTTGETRLTYLKVF